MEGLCEQKNCIRAHTTKKQGGRRCYRRPFLWYVSLADTHTYIYTPPSMRPLRLHLGPVGRSQLYPAKNACSFCSTFSSDMSVFTFGCHKMHLQPIFLKKFTREAPRSLGDAFLCLPPPHRFRYEFDFDFDTISISTGDLCGIEVGYQCGSVFPVCNRISDINAARRLQFVIGSRISVRLGVYCL